MYCCYMQEDCQSPHKNTAPSPVTPCQLTTDGNAAADIGSIGLQDDQVCEGIHILSGGKEVPELLSVPHHHCVGNNRVCV